MQYPPYPYLSPIHPLNISERSRFFCRRLMAMVLAGVIMYAVATCVGFGTIVGDVVLGIVMTLCTLVVMAMTWYVAKAISRIIFRLKGLLTIAAAAAGSVTCFIHAFHGEWGPMAGWLGFSCMLAAVASGLFVYQLVGKPSKPPLRR